MGLSIILLAAGEGKRMKTDLPKPLIKLGDLPMVQHSLNTSMKLNPDRLILVTGYKKDEVKKYVLAENSGDFIFCEQKERLGTGHAVKQALPYLPENGKTLVLYADVPLVSLGTLRKLIRSCMRKKMSILTADIDDPSGYGRIIRDKNDNPTLIREQADATKAEKSIKEIFSGIMVIENKHLKKGVNGLVRSNVKGEYYLTDLVEFSSQRKHSVGTVKTDVREVLGANNKGELTELYLSMTKLNLNAAAKKGVFFKDPSSCFIEGQLKTGKDVSIGNNVTFKGSVVLGNNVSIGSNTLISNSKIGNNTFVKDFSSIEDSKIGSNVEVGPFARLRQGVILENEAKIGNFVEVKKSKIGEGAKANHHAYLGDASVGKKSNIGAGTITCNYDGNKKHKTKLDDNVFIGSNSSLVAPVKVGKKSYVAAGSVITSDVPPNSLAFGRSKQSTKKNWKKK